MTRVSSIFSQILQLIPRLEFESAVGQHNAEHHARGFSSWGQFIAMLFCQLGHAKSLREICGGLAASEGKLRHLGVPAAPARSTLAYANTDYQWFTSLTQQGVYFVTRLKENADYGVVEKREVLPGRDVLRDEVVFFYKLEQEGKEVFYRRIEFYDQEHDRVLVFVTNHLELAAATIAAIYKEAGRWNYFSRARHGALLRMLRNFKTQLF